MDFFGKIVQGQGCNVDGTVAAQNPLARAFDSVLQSQVRSGRGRAQNGLPPPPASNDLARQMQMHRQMHGERMNPQQHNMNLMHSFEQEARHRAENLQHQQQQAAFEAAFEEASRQRQHAMMRPPQHQMAPQLPPRAMLHHPPPAQTQHSPDAWIDEFQQNLQLDSVWNSQTGKNVHEAAWEEARHQRNGTHASAHPAIIEDTAAVSASSDSRNMDTIRASRDMANTMSRNRDPKWQNSEFLQFMNQVSKGELELDDASNVVKTATGETLKPEGVLEGAWGDSLDDEVKVNRDLYESTWGDVNAPGISMNASEYKVESRSTLDDAWEESKEENANVFEDVWGKQEEELETIWKKAMEGMNGSDPFEEAWHDSTNAVAAMAEEYTYTDDNPYLNTSDTFKKGMELFQAGHLKEAILAFEAEVQQHPENSEAWRMLGESHAENDEDKRAIVCLERAIEEDPYNLPALLALGVSHVNELNSHGALHTLKAWIEHNPKFHGLEIRLDEYSDGSLMDEVTQLMLQARAHDPQDSDVQVVLGVLYNVSKDYDAAVTCFRNAAAEQPGEYSLWNKLGATLANSSRSAEAIPAYHKALELKPRYARGWLNLGISHANLGNYNEAVKCYLQALSLNEQADHIWSYLRISCTCMERFDLIKLADTRDISLFRDEFKLLTF